MLWLARDEKKRLEKTPSYCVFRKRPRKTSGVWYPGGGFGDGTEIRPSDSPVKLKPGEGPVKVKLVKA